LVEHLGPPPIGDSGVDFGVLHVLVSQVVFDELEALAVVQEMDGNTMPEAVNPDFLSYPGFLQIVLEQLLDPPHAEPALPASEERPGVAGPFLQPGPEEPAGVPEERFLSGDTALDPFDKNLVPLQVQVFDLDEYRLPNPETVFVDEIEEGPVPAVLDSGEEGLQLLLGEVLGGLLDEHGITSDCIVWLKDAILF